MHRASDPIDPASATVLFGAGVTRAAGGATASEFVNTIAAEFVASRTWRGWIAHNVQPNGEIRFETAMDELATVADPKLSVLALLNQLDPGPLRRRAGPPADRGCMEAVLGILRARVPETIESVKRR